MKKWPFLLGLGLGIVSVSLVVFLMQTAANGAREQMMEVMRAENEVISHALEELRASLDFGETLSQDDIISAAMGLGMVFYEPGGPAYSELDEEEAGEEDEEAEPEPQAVPPPPAPPSPAPSVAAPQHQLGESVVIDIPAGSSATSISAMLAQNGLVPSQQDFVGFLLEMGADGMLGTGTREIARGADFHEILEILVLTEE